MIQVSFDKGEYERCVCNGMILKWECQSVPVCRGRGGFWEINNKRALGIQK